MGRRTKNEIADDIRMQESELAHTTGFGPAGVDAAYVAAREQFNCYTHQQIWDLVHEKISPDALGQIASHWSDRAQKLHDLFDTYSQAVKREFAEWSGTFATSAQQSTNAFLAASADAHGTALTVQRLMDLNSSAAQNVRASIPPPPPPYKPDPDPAKEAADGGARLRTYQNQASAAQAGVQDTMNFVYNPTIPASGDSVPRFVPPPPGPATQPGPGTTNTPTTASQPVQHTGPGTTTASSKDGDTSDGRPSAQAPTDGSAANTAADQTPSASTNSPTATTPSSFSGLPGTGPTTTCQTVPTSITPTLSAASGATGGPGSTGIGPVSPGLLGTPGTGSPSGGGPGVSRPSEPTPAAVQANTTRTAQAANAAAQRPSSSGMPHVGHGDKKESEEDRSKASPEYLRRQYEELAELAPAGLDVIGTDPAEQEQPHAMSSPPVQADPTAEPSQDRSGYLGRGPMGDG